MKLRYPHVARWLLCACTALMLVACGGGGGGEAQEEPRDDSSDAVVPAPPPPAADPRNGRYTMVASDGYEYTLTVDFDAKTYQVVGNGVDEDGAIEADGSEFEFKPGNAEGSFGFNTTRFAYMDNTVVGAYALPSGAMPFVAARSFVTSLPSTTLTFNVLARWVYPEIHAFSSSIRQVQITSDGRIRMCNDEFVQEVDSCESELFDVPLSISDGKFSYQANETLTVTFRLANVGTDQIYLGANAAEGSTRQFTIGTPALTSFSLGSFAGGTVGPAWSQLTIQESNYSISLISPSGLVQNDEGSIGSGTGTFGNLAVASSDQLGQFVGVRSTSLSAFIAAPSNSTSAGSIFIGTLR